MRTQRTRPDGTPPPAFGRIDCLFNRGLVASAAEIGARHHRIVDGLRAVGATMLKRGMAGV